MAANLLEEFELHNMTMPVFATGTHSVAFTNSALWMFLSIAAAMLFLLVSIHPRRVVPGRWQMAAETIHNLVVDLVKNTAGQYSKPFVPFIFSIFIFILFCNLLGLIPYSLAVTSHLLVNLCLAILLFIVIIATGFKKHGLHFLHLFVPKGVPMIMLPLMFVIELFSFLVRPFTLSIRLFANMFAGHLLLIVFGSLTASLLAAHWLAPLSILPMALNIAITGFEFFVAFLQAYIFTILAAAYLRDALEMH
jgi:F-type H+-transporting ATPase subunit a